VLRPGPLVSSGIVCVLLSSAAFAPLARAQGARPHQAQGSFQVRIGTTPLPVCTVRTVGASGVRARVVCLSEGVPAFRVPGRADDFTVERGGTARGETAAQVPGSAELRGLRATGAGPAQVDTRTLESATLSAPADIAGPEEIEVSF